MSYVVSVTLDGFRAERISKNLSLISGVVDLTTYHATGVEIEEITDYFTNLLRCIADSMSDNGYHIRWNTTDKCFHAFYGNTEASAVAGLTIASSGGANITDGQIVTVTAGFRSKIDKIAAGEVADGVDVGEFNFIAIGYR